MSESPICRSVLLFGAPGVGKGTQGRILGQIPGFFHFAFGDVFRAIDIDSPDGQLIHQYTSQGELVPDELTIDIWKRAMDAFMFLGDYRPRKDLLVLDGMPRNVNQAQLLQEHVQVLQVIHLVTSDQEEMVRRIQQRALLENRADDAKEEVIRKRFRIYEEKSAPVVDCYPAELITAVDAVGSPAEVLGKILAAIVPQLKQHFPTPGG